MFFYTVNIFNFMYFTSRFISGIILISFINALYLYKFNILLIFIIYKKIKIPSSNLLILMLDKI